VDWSKQCAAVIPCFNESAFIGGVVHAVRRHLPSVIVVDDGSSDETAAIAAAAGAEVLRQPVNSGKGSALRAGWQQAFRREFAWVLTLDGDGQHAPEDIPALLDCAENTGAALVVGNRMGETELMPWLRRRVNLWMTRRLSTLVDTPLADSQCGFRLMNLNALSRLEIRANHFAIESEMLVGFIADGCKVEFVPIQVIYRTSPSRIRPVLDSWRWCRWWFRQCQLSRPGRSKSR
jgi:glycosyltransferase involved in cell wall biosynthesis